MGTSIQERLKHPYSLEIIECELLKPWEQSLPESRDSITFAHTQYRKIPGIVTVEYVDGDIQITGKIDTERSPAVLTFSGIWTEYEKLPIPTEPFNTIVLSDTNPGCITLFHDERVVDNPLKPEWQAYAAGLALDHMCNRLNSKIASYMATGV